MRRTWLASGVLFAAGCTLQNPGYSGSSEASGPASTGAGSTTSASTGTSSTSSTTGDGSTGALTSSDTSTTTGTTGTSTGDPHCWDFDTDACAAVTDWVIHYERLGLEKEVLQLASLSDGSLIATGAFRKGMFAFGESGMTSTEEVEAIYVARIHSDGNILWIKPFASFGCTSECDRVYDLSVDADDNIYLGGYFNQKFVLDDITLGGGLFAEAFYAVLGADGTVKSAREFPGPSNQYIDAIVAFGGGVAIAGTYDGDFELAGAPAPTADSMAWHAFIGKFSPGGELEWSLFGDTEGKITITSIDAVADGSVVIGGDFSVNLAIDGTTLTALGNSDGFFAKISPQGKLQWLHTIGAKETSQFINDVEIDGDGNIWLVGSCSTQIALPSLRVPCKERSGFVLKVAPDTGAGIWGLTFEGELSKIGVSARQLSLTPAGRALVLGRYAGSATIGNDGHMSNGASDMYIAELSSDGQVLWSQSMGGNNGVNEYEFSYDLAALGEDAFALAAVFYNSTGLGDFPVDFAGQKHNVFLRATY